MKRFIKPVVEIRWIDSSGASGDSVWMDLADFERRRHHSLECRTIAYLIEESDDRLLLAAHVSLNNDPSDCIAQLSGILTIPKVAVLEQRILVEGKDDES